jgi:hypothetical protein
MSRTRKRRKGWDDEYYDDADDWKDKHSRRRREKKMKKAIKTRNLDYFEEEEIQ